MSLELFLLLNQNIFFILFNNLKFDFCFQFLEVSFRVLSPLLYLLYLSLLLLVILAIITSCSHEFELRCCDRFAERLLHHILFFFTFLNKRISSI